MLKKLALIAALALPMANAFALDLYFTVNYQSYPLESSGNAGRDVVYEMEPIKLSIEESNDALNAETISLKKAYIKHIRATYPAYIERVLKSKFRDDLAKHLDANVNIAYFGSAAEAQDSISASIAHAKKLGFSTVESTRFTYMK